MDGRARTRGRAPVEARARVRYRGYHPFRAGLFAAGGACDHECRARVRFPPLQAYYASSSDLASSICSSTTVGVAVLFVLEYLGD